MAENFRIEEGVFEVRDAKHERYIAKVGAFFAEGRKTTPFNEVYTYKLSQVLGLNIVPETNYALIPVEGISVGGSVQRFIPGRVQNLKEVKMDDKVVNKEFATRIFVLDCLTGNTDRTFNNVLVDQDGRPWAIDNGFAVGFNFEAERFQRWDRTPSMARYECDLVNRYSYLHICPEMYELVDWKLAEELASELMEKAGAVNIRTNVPAWEKYEAMANLAINYRLTILGDILKWQKIYHINREETQIYAIDIDGVIATKLDNGKYPDDYEKKRVIDGARENLLTMIREGGMVVLFTARLECDRKATEDWLLTHEIPYDILVMGKPFADVYLDDKGIYFTSWDKVADQVSEVLGGQEGTGW